MAPKAQLLRRLVSKLYTTQYSLTRQFCSARSSGFFNQKYCKQLHNPYSAGLGMKFYLFEQFFVGKATEHLIEEGISAEHLLRSLGIYFAIVPHLTKKLTSTLATESAIARSQLETQGTPIDAYDLQIAR
jgi:hypothetical protein